MSARRRTHRLAGAVGPLAAATAAAVCLSLFGPAAPAAAGPAIGPLHKLACTTLKTDQAIEAPLYAQQEGASGGTDQWWCELPHPTQLPARYTELRRLVSPIDYPYADYSTYYGLPGSAGPTATTVNVPGTIVVEVDWNSTPRRPGAITYAKNPKAQKVIRVNLAKGVTGTELVSKHSVAVVWRYPQKGVPKYLHGVSTVTVVGRADVPASVVVGVARHVTPD